MLRAILNKSWQQHPTRHQLYGHLPPITKTIQVRRTRHAGHCWRSRDELIRDVLLWIPTHGRAKAGRPARTYIQQLCEDTGCCPEDLPRAMNDREEWRERVRDIRAASTIWWWWWGWDRSVGDGNNRVVFLMIVCWVYLKSSFLLFNIGKNGYFSFWGCIRWTQILHLGIFGNIFKVKANDEAYFDFIVEVGVEMYVIVFVCGFAVELYY